MDAESAYGTLYLCATPIGNLGDITYRCVDVLRTVDLIAAEDTRRTLGLLNHLEIEKPLTSYFEHNRREKGLMLLEKLKSGLNIALVSDAGTPAICDPGEDLVALCAAEGVRVVPIPGCVAAVNALIVSGLPTTKFAFEGFLSVNKRSRRESLADLATETRTMLFYEAPHKLLQTLRDLHDCFGDRRITLCRELTKLHEEVRRTTLAEAVVYYEEHAPRGEFVLVLEGRSAEENTAALQEAWTALTPQEHIARYVADGMTEKEAMRRAAHERGLSRRDLYNLVKTK